MGSGLILLLIVGAWLAVLVPMALRSHDAAAALGTVDKFHDAMRVLARRDPARRAAAAPLEPAVASPDGPSARPGPTPAARRRRALVCLLSVAALTLAGGLLGPAWLLVPHLLADLLLVAFLAWLRNAAVVRAEREWRMAMGDRHPAAQDDRTWSPLQEWSAEPDRGLQPAQPAAPRPAAETVSVPVQACGPDVFDQELLDPPAAEPALDGRARGPRAVPALPAPPVPAARGAQGAPWQPVPVPAPTYVTAARAPRRVVDLARPRPSTEALPTAQPPLAGDAQGPELEHILGRRAVNG